MLYVTIYLNNNIIFMSFEKIPADASVDKKENKESDKEDFKSELAKESYEKVESVLKGRDSIAEEILKDKNEDGSVDIDDLNLNENEATVFLEKIQRNSNEILEDLKNDLSRASEDEIQEVVERISEIDNNKDSVKEMIKGSIFILRSQENIRDSKQNAGATIKSMEHLLSDKVSEIIESDLSKAVKLKGFSRDLNFLASSIENLPGAPGLISGDMDRLQKYEEMVSQLRDSIGENNNIEILLENINNNIDTEEFNSKLEELEKIIDSFKENVDNLRVF